ncbi:hypothetical protein HIMB5_00012040 [alpha proteobacterium HIMB5]|nr:hypothetical protein HIMB5_00012040 [alpha proteobacterium HIMB5]
MSIYKNTFNEILICLNGYKSKKIIVKPKYLSIFLKKIKDEKPRK